MRPAQVSFSPHSRKTEQSSWIYGGYFLLHSLKKSFQKNYSFSSGGHQQGCFLYGETKYASSSFSSKRVRKVTAAERRESSGQISEIVRLSLSSAPLQVTTLQAQTEVLWWTCSHVQRCRHVAAACDPHRKKNHTRLNHVTPACSGFVGLIFITYIMMKIRSNLK